MADQPKLAPSKPFNPWKVFDGITVPIGILADPTLSDGAKLCLGRLLRFKGEKGRCNPAVETLAKELAKSVRRVQEYLVELETAWIIKRHGHGGEKGATNEIEFLNSAPWSLPRVRKIAPVRKTAPQRVRNLARTGAKNRTQSEVKRSESSSEVKDTGISSSLGCTVTLQSRSKNGKPLSQNADDDEQPKPRTPFQNPKEEFLARLAERHGDAVDADQVLADVQGDLGETPLVEFLEADHKATTGRLTNPHGHYRKLARTVVNKYRNRLTVRTLKVLVEPIQDHEYLARMAERYPCCGGTGKDAAGVYCSCKVGTATRDFDSSHAATPEATH